MKAYYFEGESGQDIREDEIPADVKDLADEYRVKLIDCCADYSDDIMEQALEGNYNDIDQDLIKATIRKATINLDITPVFMGSAYKNTGIQKLLDGVTDFLPSPTDVKNVALDVDNEEKQVVLSNNDNDPLVCYAFKLVDNRYGQLTYIRIYQGSLKKGNSITNITTGKKVNVGRLVRMHSDNMEEITEAYAGDIVACFG